MIEGVLRHCTEMEVEQQYVDSHGQSEVAFAFSYLLGFDLMPRLKAIASQKLSRPHPGNADAYPNLQPILTQPINWGLIRQHYDDMIKYTTALRLGTAEPESILRRFTRNNVQHPTTGHSSNWEEPSKPRFWLAISMRSRSDERSTKGSMWWKTGTVPTASSSMEER